MLLNLPRLNPQITTQIPINNDMITPTTLLEHILQLHVSTLRPVLGNLE
jgi:hypothetical protein